MGIDFGRRQEARVVLVPQRLDREQGCSRKVPNRKHDRRSWHGLSLHSPLAGESTVKKGLESPIAGGCRMHPEGDARHV